jgi:hypothetical protein
MGSLAEAGELTPARHSLRDWTWRPSGLQMPEGTALELLDRLRSERGQGNEARAKSPTSTRQRSCALCWSEE